MDSIEVPDVDKIKKLSDKKFKGSGVNRTADEIFDGEKFNKAGEFDRATKTYDDPTKHKEEDDEDDFLEDAAAMPAQAATGLSKGVKVDVTENHVSVDLSLNIRYGFNIPSVSEQVQEKVSAAIENMTGLTVLGVNIRIAGVNMEEN